jgi:hypothetical protein
MKRLIALLGLVVVGMFVGCTSISSLDTPQVTATVATDGGSIKLTWTEVKDAKEYQVTTDDTTITLATKEYTVTEPTQKLEVVAKAGDTKSTAWKLDCAPKLTGSVIVYGKSNQNPANPSGLGFTTSGDAVGYSLTNSPQSVDFVMDDQLYPSEMWMISPNAYTPPFNDRDNGVADGGGTYDNVKIVPTTGNWDNQKKIVTGGTYALWLDRDNSGSFNAGDHVAKIEVTINGDAVTLKAAWQPVEGLRWIRTK